MDGIANCADNIAAYWAPGLAAMVVLLTAVVFAFRRTLTSLCYGLIWATVAYFGGLVLIPYIAMAVFFGTLGIGTAVCASYA
jgi:hypothetical protein